MQTKRKAHLVDERERCVCGGGLVECEPQCNGYQTADEVTR